MAFQKVREVPAACATNAVIYARYSSDKQTENSIDFQLRAGYAYCESKQLRVVGEYVDRAISGTTDNRPEFQRMIKDAKKQQFAFVVVYRFDRFARNRYDSAIYKKELEGYGIRVLSTEESVGTGDESIILESIYEAMAESYSRRLSKVVTQGMRETALKGQSTGGNLAIGYRFANHYIEIDEKLAPAIKYCYEARAERIPKKKIADELNSRGYRTVKGNPFSINNVTKILTNAIYKGVYKYTDIERTCPAIVSEELWDKVQEIEQSEKKLRGKKEINTVYYLSGKIFCGNCGAALIGDSGTSRHGTKHFYYTCAKRKKTRSCIKKSEKKDFIEWYLCEQTALNILTEKNIKKIAKTVVDLAEKENGAVEIAKLEKQLRDIDRDLDATADALIKTSSPTMIKKINEKAALLEAQQAEAELQLAKLKKNRDFTPKKEDVENYLTSFTKGDLLDEEFRHRMINTLINVVYLYDDKVVIYYNLKGAKQVCHIDMLSDIDQLDDSDSITDGPPSKTASPRSGEAVLLGGPTSLNDSNPRVIAIANNIQKYTLYPRLHNCSRYRPTIFSHRIMRELRVLSPRGIRLTVIPYAAIPRFHTTLRVDSNHDFVVIFL